MAKIKYNVCAHRLPGGKPQHPNPINREPWIVQRVSGTCHCVPLITRNFQDFMCRPSSSTISTAPLRRWQNTCQAQCRPALRPPAEALLSRTGTCPCSLRVLSTLQCSIFLATEIELFGKSSAGTAVESLGIGGRYKVWPTSVVALLSLFSTIVSLVLRLALADRTFFVLRRLR